MLHAHTDRMHAVASSLLGTNGTSKFLLVSTLAAQQSARIKLDLLMYNSAHNSWQQFVANRTERSSAAAASETIISSVGGNTLNFDTNLRVGIADFVQNVTHCAPLLLLFTLTPPFRAMWLEAGSAHSTQRALQADPSVLTSGYPAGDQATRVRGESPGPAQSVVSTGAAALHLSTGARSAVSS